MILDLMVLVAVTAFVMMLPESFDFGAIPKLSNGQNRLGWIGTGPPSVYFRKPGFVGVLISLAVMPLASASSARKLTSRNPARSFQTGLSGVRCRRTLRRRVKTIGPDLARGGVRAEIEIPFEICRKVSSCDDDVGPSRRQFRLRPFRTWRGKPVRGRLKNTRS
jgi:hypothetical protein